MPASLWPAVSRLQQSNARSHHYTEYANSFHVFSLRLYVASGKYDVWAYGNLQGLEAYFDGRARHQPDAGIPG